MTNKGTEQVQMELAILKLSTKKNPCPDDFASKFYPIFKEELISTLHPLLQK